MRILVRNCHPCSVAHFEGKKGGRSLYFPPFPAPPSPPDRRGRAGHSPAALGGEDARKPAACNGFPETLEPRRRGLRPLREAEIQGFFGELYTKVPNSRLIPFGTIL